MLRRPLPILAAPTSKGSNQGPGIEGNSGAIPDRVRVPLGFRAAR